MGVGWVWGGCEELEGGRSEREETFNGQSEGRDVRHRCRVRGGGWGGKWTRDGGWDGGSMRAKKQ